MGRVFIKKSQSEDNESKGVTTLFAATPSHAGDLRM
jgi:hypothetical protein